MDYQRHSISFLVLLLYGFAKMGVASGRVLSTVIYTNHGDRTPLILSNYPNLTPLGAQQLWQAGVNMRNRYVHPATSDGDTTYTIREISSIFLENQQVDILSSDDPWVSASAQAFMQGLYPPLTYGQNYTNIEGESDLENGTNIVAPLGGYQYPSIVTASSYDLNSIVMEGAQNCPQYSSAMIGYWNTSDYLSSAQQSQQFYDSLKESIFNGVLPEESVGYWNAYYIWDYINYGWVHNTTVRRRLSPDDYTRARLLADKWMFEMYANSTSDGQIGSEHIRAIAGRTLAWHVTRAFATSIQSQGQEGKINLVFGDYKPMMSFAALADLLVPRTETFFNAPSPGASMIFELYTAQTTTSIDYPKSNEMFVRFFYKDSSDTSAPVEYPLFGSGPGAAMWMSYSDFLSSMSSITVSGVDDWCTTCQSYSAFCSISQNTQSTSTSRHTLQPAVAGVVGAISALAFIALVGGLIMIFGGVRLQKRHKRNSQLGGFKGTEKLASDLDLSVPKGGAGVHVHEQPRGHERVGSWELKEPVQTRNMPSGIDTTGFGHGKGGLDDDDTAVDPYAIPVKPRDTF